MSLTLPQLESLNRCEGCDHFVGKRGDVALCEIAQSVTLSDAATCPLDGKLKPQRTARARAAYEPQPVKVIERVPYAQWPGWAKAIACMRAAGDVGVGSTWERELGRVGVAIKLSLQALGLPCNCSGRKDDWDVRFHYINAQEVSA